MIRCNLSARLFIIAIMSTAFAYDLPAYGQRSISSTKAGEQRKAEKGLHDNRYFIYFINSTITNYGDDRQKKDFKEVIQRDIMSQFFYMKFLFYESFFQTRKAQSKLIVLYTELLKTEIVQTRKYLDQFAPHVINSKDALARHYLYLGYRETVNTRNEMVMADNFRETLYSMRLHRYVKAIKRIKEAKKYAFFAMIRAKQTDEERSKHKPFTFDDIDKKIASIVPKEELDKFKLASYDSFYKTKDSKSIFNSVWENPELESMEEMRKLLKSSD